MIYIDHLQDDLLIEWGLALLNNEFVTVNPPVADRAWVLAIAAAGQRLTPTEAIRQVEHATVTKFLSTY